MKNTLKKQVKVFRNEPSKFEGLNTSYYLNFIFSKTCKSFFLFYSYIGVYSSLGGNI